MLALLHLQIVYCIIKIIMDNSGGVAMPQVTSEHQNKIREKILKSTYRLFVSCLLYTSRCV